MKEEKTFIENEQEYDAIMARQEVLLKYISEDTPPDDLQLIEYAVLARCVQQYEEAVFNPPPPTIAGLLQLKLGDMGITQGIFAQMLGVSPSRVSEWVTGKSIPPPPILRQMRDKLNIPADLILDAIAI